MVIYLRIIGIKVLSQMHTDLFLLSFCEVCSVVLHYATFGIVVLHCGYHITFRPPDHSKYECALLTTTF